MRYPAQVPPIRRPQHHKMPRRRSRLQISSSRPQRRRRSWVQRLILTLNVFLIAGSLLAAAALQYAYDRASDIKRVELGRSLTPLADSASSGGRVMNILLVGSDSSAGLDPDDPVQIGRQGERFGDVVIIAHVDERTQQMALLSIPRDLWVPLAGTNRSDRINRAFQLGGPAMLIDTIELTFDIPIHHYVNVDFAGFQGLVEAVGSVDVYFETPARDWNVNAKPKPRTQTGFFVGEAGCHSLDAPTALAYVRSRFYQTQLADGTWITDPRSDLGRISRQQDFLRRLMFRAIDLGARNPFVLKDLIDAGLANVAIDDQLTPQLLLDVGTTYRSFNPDELQTYSIPAVDAEIDGNQVLQPVWTEVEPLLKLMRGADFDDPATVNVAVIGEIGGGSDAQELHAGISGVLSDNGFQIETHHLSAVDPGITIHYGPDGQAAAALVSMMLQADASALGLEPAAIPIEQVDGLRGRTVQVRIGALHQESRESNTAAASKNLGQTPTSDGSNPAQPDESVAEDLTQNPPSQLGCG